MADRGNQNECVHPSCACPVPGDEKYCGPHCETAPETAVICGCGHEACRTVAGAEGAQVA